MDSIISYRKTDDMYSDTAQIVETAQRYAYKAVDNILTLRNWMIGKRIAEETLKGAERAEYGTTVMKNLSRYLTENYGRGFSKRNLYEYLRFYRTYPEIVHFKSAQFDSDSSEIVHTENAQSFLLGWTHYRVLLQVLDKDARAWYEREAYNQNWSIKTLQRNISTQYYYRILKTSDPAGVEEEMKKLTTSYQDKLEFIKNPVIAEFLGMQQDTKYHESDLEQAIISNLQNFLMELGKGYAFVARQQHIHTEKEDYYIDLVFYNYILKCFVLVDLKTGKITHQDVGQMDMYIRMYDDLKKRSDDNPTLGIVLCTDTDEDIARYSVLHGNEQLFASKYKLFLPSEEELRAEIETQKQFFLMQQAEKEKETSDEGMVF